VTGAADYLQVSVFTIDRLIETGHLPPKMTSPSPILILTCDALDNSQKVVRPLRITPMIGR
jgi:hypothetical protein